MHVSSFDQSKRHRHRVAGCVVLLTSVAYAVAGLLVPNRGAASATAHLLLPIGCALFPVLFALAILRIDQARQLSASRRRLALCIIVLAGGCLAFYAAVWAGA